MPESMWDSIVQKVRKEGYKSIIFDLALVREDSSWKVLIARIIFDIGFPLGHQELLKKTNFAIERFSLPFEDFQRFFEYLTNVDVSSPMTVNKLRSLGVVQTFEIGSYKLNFNGNFPSKEANFSGRQRAKNPRGLERPVYYFDYSLQNSVIPHSYHKIDLSGNETPFGTVFDAVNKHWNANFEQFHLSSAGCAIYMPIYDASIADCNSNGNYLTLKIEFDKTRTSIDDLSVGIIASNGNQKYSKRHSLQGTSLEVDVGFVPTFATIYLNKGEEKLDEYYYNSSPPPMSGLSLESTDVPKTRVNGDRSREIIREPYKEKIYATGEQYDVYKDLRNIVKSASKEVFIVDAYPDESLYELYVESVPTSIPVKILTKKPPSKFVTVGELLANKRPIEIRENSQVHDRYIFVDDKCWMLGSSIKDAGSKPTVLVKIDERDALYNLMIDVFNSGTKLLG